MIQSSFGNSKTGDEKVYKVKEIDGKEYVSLPVITMNADGTIDGNRLIELLGIDANWPTCWDMVMANTKEGNE